jgi:hypothetical protein
MSVGRKEGMANQYSNCRLCILYMLRNDVNGVDHQFTFPGCRMPKPVRFREKRYPYFVTCSRDVGMFREGTHGFLNFIDFFGAQGRSAMSARF